MNLIMVSHNYHSFLLNEIEYACTAFKKVVVFTLENDELRLRYSDKKNVQLYLFTKSELHKEALKHLYQIFEREKAKELLSVVREKKLSKDYIKQFLLYVAMENICVKYSKLCGLSKDNDRNYAAIACWYASDAYAVYRLKEKYKNLNTFSLAHSFEVDPIKNNYIMNLFRKKYHDCFNKVYFISSNVKNEFINRVAEKLCLACDNVDVKYLGTSKKEKGFTKHSIVPPFRILTCSYVVPVKRIIEFYYILNKYVDMPIIWTHIGEGTDYKKLYNLVQNNDNQNLKVELLGTMSNDEIHKYYVNENVDVFVNYSTSEGIPVSIMEAIAYGVPVVATKVGGNSEIVNSEFGVLVSPDTEGGDLWKIIAGLIQEDDFHKSRLKRSASAFFENNFNADLIRADFYKEILHMCQEKKL